MGLSVLSELDGGEVRSRVAAQPSFGELVRAAWMRRRARRSAGEPPGALEPSPPVASPPSTSGDEVSSP